MKQVTKGELQHTKNFADVNGNDVDWYALKDEIPNGYKDDFNDDMIFELVRPWPLRRGHKYGFRDIFNGQGGTMDYRFLKESIQNYEFFKKILQKYSPKVILETGTNACIFDWFCYKFLDDFELHTVDINGNSKYFVNEVNKHFGKNNIHFYEDNSPSCINRLFFNKKFDLAFLDAGHSYPQLLGELESANTLEIPVLIVDDFSDKNLDKAINDFVAATPYKIVETKSGTEGVKYNDENGNPVNNKKVGYVKVMEREKE